MNIAVGSNEWIKNEFLPSSLSLWAFAEVNVMCIPVHVWYYYTTAYMASD